MTRYYIILICFLTVSSAVFADNEIEELQDPRNFRRERSLARSPFPTEVSNDLLTPEQQLKFGIVVLNQRFYTLREEGYAHFLRELLNITGFSAQEAEQIIQQYAHNHRTWEADLREIQTILISNRKEDTDDE